VQSPMFKYNCAAILRNLTVCQENLKAVVLTIGVVRLLLNLASADEVATREHVAIALHNICTARDPAHMSTVARNDGVHALIGLSESLGPVMKTFCGLALQRISGSVAGGGGSDKAAAAASALDEETSSRLVVCMLAIGEVNDAEPLRVVEARLLETGLPVLIPGRTHGTWDDHPSPSWPIQTYNCSDLIPMESIDPLGESSREAASQEVTGVAVERPRARQLPHDEPELILGDFDIMSAPLEKAKVDQAILARKVAEGSGRGGHTFPAIRGGGGGRK